MTELLRKAIDEARKTPPEVQDVIANLILSELQDELTWQKAFENTEEEQWDRLADRVHTEIRSGDTEPLDRFLQ